MRQLLLRQDLTMFGYLAAQPGALTEEQQSRYRACYCGLCRALKLRHGELARLTLNYDLTFLVLLLGSLYEPEESTGELRCIAHPKTPHAYISCEITDYAADMNVMLAYLKCMDDWEDEAKLTSLAEAKALKRAYQSLSKEYPRQHSAMVDSIAALRELEKAHDESPDAAAATFGTLMAEILVWREDRWSGLLRAMGMALGEFIYIMDAAMDLDADTRHNSYNPFRRYYGLDNEQRFRSILKMLISEAVFYFDKLPLVQDVDILKNILCLGLWQQFDSKFSADKNADEKGKKDVSGSV